jgi:hypothetical protein
VIESEYLKYKRIKIGDSYLGLPIYMISIMGIDNCEKEKIK